MNTRVIMDTLLGMDSEDFSKIAVSLMQKMGLEVETHRSKDNEVFIEGKKTKSDGSIHIFKVVFVNDDDIIDPKQLQRLAEKRLREDEELIFFTTSDFSPVADEYGEEMEIGLIDGQAFAQLLEKHNMAADLLRPEEESNSDSQERYLPSVAELQDLMERGEEYFQFGKFKKALACFEKAILLKEKYTPAWRMKAKCMFEMGNKEEAVDVFKKALTMDVYNPDMWFELAEMLYDMGEHEAEIECYDQAIVLNKKFGRAWNNRGATLFDMDDIDGAMSSFEKAVEVSPGLEDAWHNMGLAHKRRGEFKEALKAYYKALALNSGYFEARLSLINLLNEMQRYEESVDHCRTALKADESDERVWYLLAMAFKGLALYNKAIYSTKRALKITPSSETLRRLKADLEFLLERYGDDVPVKPLFDSDIEEVVEEADAEDEVEAEVVVEPEPVIEDIAEADAGVVEEVEAEVVEEADAVLVEEADAVLVEEADAEVVEEADAEDEVEPEVVVEPEPVIEDIAEAEIEDEVEPEVVEEVDELPEPGPDAEFVEPEYVEAVKPEREEERYEFFPPVVESKTEAVVEDVWGERVKEEPIPEKEEGDSGSINVFLKEVDNILQKAEEDVASSKDMDEEVIKPDEYDLPSDFDGLVKSARILLLLGKIPAALEAANRALAIDEKDDEVWVLKGNALFHLERMDGALEAYSNALRKNPRCMAAMLNREEVFHIGGHREEQIHASSRISEMNNDIWLGWGLKGDGLLEEESNPEAIESFEQALSIQPDISLLENLGSIALLMEGRYEEAMERFTEMVSSSSSDSTAWVNRGVILYLQGNKEQALESFDRVVKMQPSSALAWNNRGLVLFEMGEKDEARISFDTAITKDKEASFAWVNRGVLASIEGNTEEALEHLEKAVYYDDEDHIAWFHLGNIQWSMGDKDKAFDSISRACSLIPSNIQYQKAMGEMGRDIERHKEKTGKDIEGRRETPVDDDSDSFYSEDEEGDEMISQDVGVEDVGVEDVGVEDVGVEDVGVASGVEDVSEDEMGEEISEESTSDPVEQPHEIKDSDEENDLESMGFFFEPISESPPPPLEEEEGKCLQCGIELSGGEKICPLCGVEL